MPNLTPFTPNWPDQGEGRHEPETFGASVPDDPYKAWLAERESEHERQQEASVRWVVRPPTVAAPAIHATTAAAESLERRADRYGRRVRLTGV
ncbi:MAG TPA: hypothetical protein VGO14_05900 [Solirubrobacteraceae bacterium]|jgi:hypothetical protein|nr:hypothetical protein [Solirubrobacteraceae bacterium]